MKYFYLTLILCFIALSENLLTQQTGFKENKIGQTFNISVPDYYAKTYGLNDIAVVQYQSAIKDAYTIVISEEKEKLKALGVVLNNSKEYIDFIIQNFGVPDVTVILNEELIINSYKSSQAIVNATVDSVQLFYLVTVIETPNYFYNIMSWSTIDKKDALIADFKKIAISLKE